MAAKSKQSKGSPIRTRGSGAEEVRKVTRTGNYTFYVTIPKTHLDALGWRERQRVVVRRQGDKLVIEDWK